MAKLKSMAQTIPHANAGTNVQISQWNSKWKWMASCQVTLL